MKIAIGNDQHGLAYKQMLLSTFAEHEFVDMASYDTLAVSFPAFA